MKPGLWRVPITPPTYGNQLGCGLRLTLSTETWIKPGFVHYNEGATTFTALSTRRVASSSSSRAIRMYSLTIFSKQSRLFNHHPPNFGHNTHLCHSRDRWWRNPPEKHGKLSRLHHLPVSRTTKSITTLPRTPRECSMPNKRLCESVFWLGFKLVSPASQSPIDWSSPSQPRVDTGWRSGDRSPFKCVVDDDELVIVWSHRHRVGETRNRRGRDETWWSRWCVVHLLRTGGELVEAGLWVGVVWGEIGEWLQ